VHQEKLKANAKGEGRGTKKHDLWTGRTKCEGGLNEHTGRHKGRRNVTHSGEPTNSTGGEKI